MTHRGERDWATSMWDPARPWNVECGRNICHKFFMLLMHRGRRGRDKAREENGKRGEEAPTEHDEQREDEDRRLQVERKRQRKKKISPPYFSCLRSCFGRKCGRDSRTRVLNVAQCWQSRVWAHSVGAPNLVAQRNMAIQTKQQSPSQPIYPASAYIPHKPAVGFSI